MFFGFHWLRVGNLSDALAAQSPQSRFLERVAKGVAAQIEVDHVEVFLPNLPDDLNGVVIAQLSDIHLGPHTTRRDVRSIVAATNKIGADLIVLTGDYVHSPFKAADASCSIEECARELSFLYAPLGIFAVLGNHDLLMNGREQDSTADLAIEVLTTYGIPVLENVAVPLYRNGSRFWLAGVEDMIMSVPDLNMALHGVPCSEPTILLVHEPDFAVEACKHHIDLQLSGHSHGGQVVLPRIGPVTLPYGARLFPTGLTQVRKMKLYTNRGIGYSKIPLRMNCSPEITALTLTNNCH